MLKGTIIKRGKKYCIVTYAFTPEGEKKQKWISGFSTKKEAEKYLRDYNKKLQNDDVFVSHILLADFLKNWLVYYCERKCLADNTIRGYRVNIFNHIVPYIGNVYLDELNAKVFDYLFDCLTEKGLSGTSQLYVYRVLHKAFQTGVKRREIPFNYCDMVEPPKANKTDLKCITGNNIKVYYDYLCNIDIRFSLPILFGLFLGLRRGEVLGLKWCDFDFDNNTVFIQRTATPSKSGFELSDCKTEKSKRVLLVPEGILDKLKEWQQVQNSYHIENIDDFVFMQSNGKILSATTLNKHYKKSLVDCGFPDMRFHDLRHSCASFLVSNSIPINTVSQILGHSKISTTLDIYTHTDFNTQKKAIEMFDDIVNC